MKSVLLHESITKHDAIGNDITHMYQILGRKHEVFVYCSYLLNNKTKRIDREALLGLSSDENNLLIYHHSNYWEEGEEILNRASAKVIIKYHCITPPSFFKVYSDDYYLACKNGRKQTLRLYEKHNDALWMGDSYHNLVDARICGYPNTVVVPPFNNLEQWKDVIPDEAILKSLMESPCVNLLFVGRVAPNKGHRHLIKIVRDYVSHYGADIVIYIVGKEDGKLCIYNKELEELIVGYGLEDRVVWVREVNDSILLSYYLGCDFYLNCSEHEGFCVPIVEAQSLCLPVIANRASAIPETIGKEQLILNDDVSEYSAAIHILSENDSYRDYLVKMGRENYLNRFSNSLIEKEFVRAVQDYAGVSL